MQSYPISSLRDGSWCNPVSIGGIMRNLKIIRSNDCATKVEGERRDDFNGPWSHFTDYVGNSLMVYPIAAPIKKEEKQIQKEIKVNSGVRGRAKIQIDITWPDKFKMKDLVALHPTVSPAVLYLRVKEAIENRIIHEIGREKQANGKGKPSVIYSKIQS